MAGYVSRDTIIAHIGRRVTVRRRVDPFCPNRVSVLTGTILYVGDNVNGVLPASMDLESGPSAVDLSMVLSITPTPEAPHE